MTKPVITMEQAQTLVGKHVVAVKKDGSRVSGKLVSVRGGKLHFAQEGGVATTKAILPLALFDLLAVGTAPYAGGYYGYGPYGYGYDPFFW